MGDVGYRELAAGPELADRVDCLWYRTEDAGTQLIVPDGGLDLIWLDARELMLVGADSTYRTVALVPGVRTTGIRLRPEAAGSVLGRSARDVLDQQVPAEQIWPERAGRLTEQLRTATPRGQLDLLRRFVSAQPGTTDRLVGEAARLLTVGSGRISRLADRLGVSERQLHRRTTAAVGYGPKTLARVLRSRRLGRVSASSLADLAQRAGYASQAHMGDDVRALTGLTPVRFLEYLGRRDVLA